MKTTNGVMNMKMSDVFTGELIHYESGNRGFYGDIGQVTSETTGCKTFITIASYRDKYDYAVAICQAVNNHDRLTSENVEMRCLVRDLIDELKAWQNDYGDFDSHEFIESSEKKLEEWRKANE